MLLLGPWNETFHGQYDHQPALQLSVLSDIAGFHAPGMRMELFILFILISNILEWAIPLHMTNHLSLFLFRTLPIASMPILTLSSALLFFSLKEVLYI